MKNSHLPKNLVHRILERLGQTADVTPEGLRSLYAAWCQHISFDNVRKLN